MKPSRRDFLFSALTTAALPALAAPAAAEAQQPHGDALEAAIPRTPFDYDTLMWVEFADGSTLPPRPPDRVRWDEAERKWHLTTTWKFDRDVAVHPVRFHFENTLLPMRCTPTSTARRSHGRSTSMIDDDGATMLGYVELYAMAVLVLLLAWWLLW